jgi:hypothetical protein
LLRINSSGNPEWQGDCPHARSLRFARVAELIEKKGGFLLLNKTQKELSVLRVSARDIDFV